MHYEDKKTGFKFDAVSGLPKENTAEAFEELFAANKAAEEGGLPNMPSLDEDWILSNGYVYTERHMREYARQAIAADRASRQVANKAEVESGACSHVWNDFGQLGGRNVSWCPRCDVLAWTGKEPEATPPATTGASTVLTDERIEWILRDLGVKAADRGEPMTSINFAREIEREVAAQAGQVAPDDKLHDAIMRLPCKPGRAISMNGASLQAYKEGHRDARHAAAELAAGAAAGQVAVPEGFALVPMIPTAEMVEAMAEDEWKWEDLLAAAEAITEEEYSQIAAAPSPAKESK